jgi:hypothetical protein
MISYNLLISTQKTVAVAFHTRQKRSVKTKSKKQYGYLYKAEPKFLGTCISENRKGNVYVKSLSSKWSTVCYIIESLKEVVSPPAILNICFANCHVHVRYSLMFWCRDTENTGIYKLQKMFMQIINGTGKQTSCTC